MTAQKAKDLLLKVDTNGAGSFVTVGAAGAHARLQRGHRRRDRHGVGRDGAGVKAARITGNGIFKDASTDETVRQYFFNGTVRNWQVIVPQLGTVEGPFQIASLEYAGQHDGEVSFDMGLESAGALSFAAAA